MKISYNWLKQFLNIDWPAEKTGELLTDLGLEIEGIEPFESVKGGLKGIVVGKVITCEQHPNADRLKVTTVDIGEDEHLKIVCGAPNVAAGQKVPVATIGTTLYTEEGEAWKIKKGKIRGEVSEGMICAEDELGLGTSHDGIMVLDENIKIGTPAAEIFNIENDHVFEIGLTPNRADAMSHWGTARDLKAGLLQQEINTELITPSVSSFHVDSRTLKIDIDVNDYDLAPRYCGLTITGLKVDESPTWLQNRLKAIGLTPKNNIVDITNYVLHELGQPLHAFDASKISGNKVVVKTLPEGTKFTTLDEVERELSAEDLMICDAEKPMCIAGVFGGIHSGVTEETTSIFLESAYFNPVSIRKTAKRHGLNTDASFRFERGIDPNITDYALKRAALLILDIAGGEISSDVMDFYPKKIEDFQVRLSFDNAKKLIGEEIPRETIKSILTSLEIKVNNVTEAGLGLTVPAYRNEVQREADVIEEILRVYGYNNINTTEKLNASISNTSKFEDYKLRNVIGNQLASQGFYEILSNSLTTPKYAELSKNLNSEHNVEMLNPLSNDLSVLRQSLLFSGLEAVSYNINRKRDNLKLYEFGKSYHSYDNGHEELKHLALFVSGNKSTMRWNAPIQKSDFFYLKGVVNSTLDRLGLGGHKVSPIKTDIFSEGIALSLGKTKLVEFGMISKTILKHFGITQEVLYADFSWDNILELAKGNDIQFKDIPKYPEVRRDFALLIDDTIKFEDIDKIAMQTEKHLLKDVDLFDVYHGKNLPKGKKSYAVSFTLQDEKKTLTDKQIDKIMSKLQTNFEKQLGAELR
ncbi:phenylalanine--tRNA ligase subunit beta [Psychroserpens sp.]|uniref:phenylalanine--tRNA ligase subunit beta n=1 Tax=Psychroserpens sp. TaxID=2020870 RepID=UPI001B0AC3CC|nr:phenylalanine--tRNA ligase subunit beta [Psychroserpens sp.]MBO6607462.1 phenylalanine--tRNA ligase subunit beta [Psychroserpens sp.]MBO6631087.1 phenylalanine--tRNA ligase subunit beta [Psychroserpens sp.]MBO6654460.1 phenylalanine--tRNA ligase subunit beta [Psychroserpens sp.]MBO6681191.1 phenylalanine--tRNA ligase subunit beta [Psychroserpens sp.]MBO6749852.1 phenylalanine--tRNA ligase subunit beta [Psychroserpens sp.]